MQNFYETTHCTLKVHCKTCRSKSGGKEWRKSMAKVFNLPEDFPCPLNIQWNEGKDKNFIDYEDAKKIISELPTTPLSIILKEEVRLIEQTIENNTTKTSCWKKRLRNRAITFLETASDKDKVIAEFIKNRKV